MDTAKDQLTACDSDTGECRIVSVELPEGRVKLGGLSYESRAQRSTTGVV